MKGYGQALSPDLDPYIIGDLFEFTSLTPPISRCRTLQTNDWDFCVPEKRHVKGWEFSNSAHTINIKQVTDDLSYPYV